MAKLKPETENIRGQLERTQYREHSVPLFMTSSFTFQDAEQMAAMFAGDEEGDIYSRYANPNTDEFCRKMCRLEGAESGFPTSSGMAAIWASIAGIISKGEHLLASRAVFGSTHQILTQILPRFGIESDYVEPGKIEEWESHIRPNTKMILLETPSNPGLALIDLEQASQLAKKHGLILNVDNCFSTPVIQNPIKYGVDLVTHSTTKYIDGQGRTLGGIVVGNAELIEKIVFFCRHTGPAMSPFNAWILSKSLETLHLRMEKHSSNALTLAQYLEQHPSVSKVMYPHLPSHPQYELATSQMRLGGGVVSFFINGGIVQGRSFMNALEMCSLSANLGDSRTIATHPATSTHSKLSEDERAAVGITDSLVRISVGLEHIDDIVEDIQNALSKAVRE
ncbi:MAG: aminotransferase class I/II-fold pyridoxal phosphate-dependent enzyme [Saprospiraceae bacterium]|nr:aminotransferase class I/II-fold pyridoxal phosphate-dependent enzyme [Saprospiraceae bacterium]